MPGLLICVLPGGLPFDGSAQRISGGPPGVGQTLLSRSRARREPSGSGQSMTARRELTEAIGAGYQGAWRGAKQTGLRQEAEGSGPDAV